MAQPPFKIELTEKEDEICRVLDGCARELREKREDLKGLELRVAGGWVRDKLLSLPSDDLDIALSAINGHPFALLLSSFLTSRFPDAATSSIAKIEANPDQSKHLETARMKVLGIELDFVGLRNEVYAEGSRIPTETFGTPLQDALRRDNTINALFYNIHTREVEDFTEKGLSDLANGLIRTPLPALQTFRDDPLRVLRCVRFASRFGFRLDEDAVQAARQPEIREAVGARISRERVGIEVEKMLKGPNPLQSLHLINRLDLHNTIFSLFPPTREPAPAPPQLALAAANIFHILLSPNSPVPIHPALLADVQRDSTLRKRLWLAAALVPWRGLEVKEKKKIVPAVESVVHNGLKLGNAERAAVSNLFHSAHLLSSPTPDKFASHPQGERAAIGITLRHQTVHKPSVNAYWSSSTLWALVDELLPLWSFETQSLDAHRAKPIAEVYNAFAARVVDLALPSELEAHPLLNGNAIMQLLSIKGGKILQTLTERVVEWQFAHPQGTPAQCAHWLKAEWDAGRLGGGEVRKSEEDGDGGKRRKKSE